MFFEQIYYSECKHTTASDFKNTLQASRIRCGRIAMIKRAAIELGDQFYENPEHEAITRSYPVLVGCISQCPKDIKDCLVPLGILAPADLHYLTNHSHDNDDKARRIVDRLQAKVKEDRSCFRNIIEYFGKISSIKRGLDKLKESYAQVLEENQKWNISLEHPNPQDSTKTSSSEWSFHTANSSFSSTESLNLYMSVKKEPSLSAHGDRQICFEERDLMYETRIIKEKFSSLITMVVISMRNSGVLVQDFIFFLSRIETFKADLTSTKNQLMLFNGKLVRQLNRKCQTVNQIFEEVDGFYSWFNHNLIKEIIETFCKNDKAVGQMMDEYSCRFKNYCKNRLCRVQRNGFNFLHKDRTPVIFKIDREWQVMRISTIDTITAIIRHVLKVKRSTICLRSASNGCVELTYDIPDQVADMVFPLPRDQVDALEKHKIYYVRCEMEMYSRVRAQSIILGNVIFILMAVAFENWPYFVAGVVQLFLILIQQLFVKHQKTIINGLETVVNLQTMPGTFNL